MSPKAAEDVEEPANAGSEKAPGEEDAQDVGSEAGSGSYVDIIEDAEEDGYDLLDEVFQMKRHKSQKEEAAAAAKLEESKDSSQFEIIDTSVSKDLLQAKKPEEKKQE